MTTATGVDAVVVGGGAAGLSAALVLGRARKHVLMVDRRAPSNLASSGIGGLVGQDRYPPGAFYETARQQLAHYPTVSSAVGTVTSLHTLDGRVAVVLGDGTRIEAAHVVLAMGMRYAKPPIDGIDAFWGKSVFHCPFCHGWEHRDKIIVAAAHDDSSVDRAILLTNWTDDVTAVVAPGTTSPDHHHRLAAAGVHLEVGTISVLHGSDRDLTSVELADGSKLRADALLVPAPHVARDELVERAGIATTATGHVHVDADGRTSLAGVWAAGDLADPAGNVPRALAAGSTAAIAIVRELTAPGPRPAPGSGS